MESRKDEVSELSSLSERKQRREWEIAADLKTPGPPLRLMIASLSEDLKSRLAQLALQKPSQLFW